MGKLNKETGALILAAIEAKPGITQAALVEATGVLKTMVCSVIQSLANEGRIHSEVHNRRAGCMWFIRGTETIIYRVEAVIKDSDGPIGSRAIAAAANLELSQVGNPLNILIQRGVIVYGAPARSKYKDTESATYLHSSIFDSVSPLQAAATRLGMDLEVYTDLVGKGYASTLGTSEMQAYAQVFYKGSKAKPQFMEGV